MRPAIASAARIGSVIGEVTSPRCFVCRDCVARAAATSTSQGQRRSYASEPGKPDKAKRSLVDTEKWRKRIWGTDSPPGLKDPYSGSQIAPELNRPQPGEIEALEEEPAQEARIFEGVTTDEAQAHDPDYTPATSWQGLDKIGGAKGWWEKVWDEDNKFEAFAQPTKRRQWTVRDAANYVHRAYVETKVLQEAGLDINEVKYIPIETDIQHRFVKIVKQEVINDEAETVQEKSETAKEQTTPVKVEGKNARKKRKRLEREGQRGVALVDTLEFPTEAWRQAIIEAVEPTEDVVEDEFVEDEVDAVTAADSSADAVTPTTSEAQAVVEDLDEPAVESMPADQSSPEINLDRRDVPSSWDRSGAWRQVSLGDQDFKFAVVKRVMQLTGHKIPDTAIQASDRLGSLLKLGLQSQPPKKLAAELFEKSKTHLPFKDQWKKAANVTLHPRRVTYVDKEKQVGRWKVIESELVKRDLPLPKRSSSKY